MNNDLKEVVKSLTDFPNAKMCKHHASLTVLDKLVDENGYCKHIQKVREKSAGGTECSIPESQKKMKMEIVIVRIVEVKLFLKSGLFIIFLNSKILNYENNCKW